MDARFTARIVLVLAATLGAPTGPTSVSAQAVPHRTVLTIHTGAETFPANPILDAGIREALASRADEHVSYFAEYLESDAFPTEEAALAFIDYIRRKYRGRRIDVVIVVTDMALRFVLNHRGELFPDTPIVTVGLGGPDEIVRQAGAGATGLRVGVAYAETLELALQLHPSTRRVFVVANGADAQTLASVQAEFRDFSRRVDVAFLDEATVPRLLAAVKAVPQGSLILYIFHSQQDPGQVVYPDEIARLVAQAAPVPVYGTSDFYIGSGVVGGVVRGTRETGTRTGDMALRILRGARAQDIPIETARVVPVLDWRQLRRWGISEARLPSDAVVMFREPSAWERYRVYILATAAVLLAQTALIVGLLVQRARRRQAEEQVRGSQAELRRSFERIRDLGGRLLNAQDTERARIARELHDDISQQVALLAIDLELLGRAVEEGGEELVGEALNRAQAIARSVHDLSHRLHPAKLRLIGLVSALDALQRELSRSGIPIVFLHENVPPSLPADVTLCLYRIVQEALQNALKHSKAHEVTLHLRGSPEGIALTIFDDGVGFDLDEAWSRGLGLVSMRERLEGIGGALEIQSGPGAGTRLEIVVPLQAQRVQAAALSAGAASTEPRRPSSTGAAQVRADSA